ncbi:MAG: ABC transporter ATP-binding protein [Methylococcaceae bacterium]
MNGNIIELKNIYKKFYKDEEVKQKYTKKIITNLQTDLTQEPPYLDTDEFWVLKNISLQIKQGDSLAIIGARESGKSILLKIISNRLQRDYGLREVNGKCTFLLDELRVGLNGYLSGWENLYLKAALTGISKSTVNDMIDEIMDFSELDIKLLEKPWKYNTTEIKNRIMYSFVVHCRYDIFIVDGLTHVGNEAFAKKCKEKIAEISRESTFIIATRHARKVKDICNKLLVLEKGEIKFFGDINDGLKFYA